MWGAKKNSREFSRKDNQGEEINQNLEQKEIGVPLLLEEPRDTFSSFTEFYSLVLVLN